MEIHDIPLQSEEIFSTERFIPREKQDRQAEEQIAHCLSSPTFSNEVILYSYDYQSYPLRIIHNPEQKTLITGNSQFQIPAGFFPKESLPLELMDHLKDFIKNTLNIKSIFIEQGFIEGEPPFDLFADFTISDDPQLLPSIDTPPAPKLLIATEENFELFDAEIKSCFTSAEKVNKVFRYYMNNETYQVRILRNPQKETFTIQREYTLDDSTEITTVTFWWSHKNALLVDKKAPSKLLNHIRKIFQETLPPTKEPEGLWNYIREFFGFPKPNLDPDYIETKNGMPASFTLTKRVGNITYTTTYEAPETHFDLFQDI